MMNSFVAFFTQPTHGQHLAVVWVVRFYTTRSIAAFTVDRAGELPRLNCSCYGHAGTVLCGVMVAFPFVRVGLNPIPVIVWIVFSPSSIYLFALLSLRHYISIFGTGRFTHRLTAA